jgi:uncharacterized protein (DUF111 family)
LTSDERTEAGVRLIHLDAVGGVAGDMFVAAMLDAFPSLRDRVLADINAVLPAEAGAPAIDAGHSGGVRALRFRLEAASPGAPHGREHHHEHHHEHGSAGSHGTSFAALRARIAGAGLSEGTAGEAVAILTILAEAEGLLPVPAPATAEILSGFRWRDDGIAGERVTPTGAAILRHLCRPSPAGTDPLGTLTATGTGAGTRELDGMPNILRATAFADSDRAEQETVDILSFDIDDMTGEEIAVAAERLRGLAGVLELGFQTVAGKKGRPLCRFEIMARPGNMEAIARAVFTETSTLGLRWRGERRRTLPRRHEMRAGRRVKTAARPGGAVTAKVESDELADIEGLAKRRAVARTAETQEPADE